jgi:drug/metabolite transporter (DMT)-like permease
MSVGGLILLIATLVSGEKLIIPTKTSTWIAFLYLVILASVIGFIDYLYVLRNWSASGASYAFVLVPLVTIVVASTLAGEVITPNFLISAVLVLAGALIGALLPPKAKPAVFAACTDSSGEVLPRCA